ncbi:MAG: phosphosulfolactate synthase [Bacteroidota bacterium]
MNFDLNHLPIRNPKPREKGITMVMDKGLSVRETEDFVSMGGGYADIVKLGFGTAMITPNLETKLKVYADAGIPVYFGGTLFEAFIIRNRFEDYIRLLEKYKLKHAEISDGSITLNHKIKLDYIQKLSKYVTVISEVGSKDEGIIIHPNIWIDMINSELEAGVWKVIAEARESGTIGIFRPNGKAKAMLINRIIQKVDTSKVIWETPQKAQQAHFIKLLGANVNLGNIAPNEVIPLETLRLGLRSDTFFEYLPEELKQTTI